MYANLVIFLLAIAAAAAGKVNNVPRRLGGIDPSDCQELGGTTLTNGSCQICTSPDSCCTTASDGIKECHACSTASSDQAAPQNCLLWTCIPNNNEGLMTCSGCGSFLNGMDFGGYMICFDYTCEIADFDKDTGGCVCNQVSYIGTDCGACSYVNGELIFDCSSVGGPLYDTSPPSTTDPPSTAEVLTSTEAPTETPVVLTPNPSERPSAIVTLAPTFSPTMAPTIAPTMVPVTMTMGSPSTGTMEGNEYPWEFPINWEEGGDSAPAPLIFQASSATCLKQGLLSILSGCVFSLLVT
jgi:hypothetical protein